MKCAKICLKVLSQNGLSTDCTYLQNNLRRSLIATIEKIEIKTDANTHTRQNSNNLFGRTMASTMLVRCYFVSEPQVSFSRLLLEPMNMTKICDSQYKGCLNGIDRKSNKRWKCRKIWHILCRQHYIKMVMRQIYPMEKPKF